MVALVVGGGEYGLHHARQLARAIRAGRLEPGSSVVVLDRDPDCLAMRTLGEWPEVTLRCADWFAGLSTWLTGAARPGDHVIPAPYSPHLLWSWLLESVPGLAPAPPPLGWRLPYEEVSATQVGVAFVSAAAWRCPVTCVEPAHCPALRAPRDWDLAAILRAGAADAGWKPLVFPAYHLAFGIASVPVAALLEARAALLELPVGGRALVATSSHCHAAIGGVIRASG